MMEVQTFKRESDNAQSREKKENKVTRWNEEIKEKRWEKKKEKKERSEKWGDTHRNGANEITSWLR